MTPLTKHGFIRVAVASPSLVLGHPGENREELRTMAEQAHKEGCRLIVFPELCVTGYSCADLFFQSSLRAAAIEQTVGLAADLEKIPIACVVGLPLEVDGRLYNVAAVLSAGRVLGIVPKSYLPNAGEFYERRWFSPAHTLNRDEVEFGGEYCPIGIDLLFPFEGVNGATLGVEICEDLWGVTPPSFQAALQGATILANPSASDELLGKAAYRKQLVQQQSARTHSAYLYAAAGPGESSTDLVYSGHSIIAENGALLGESERFRFEPQMVIVDVDVQHLVHERLHNSSFRDDGPSVDAYREVPIPWPKSGKDLAQAPVRRPLRKHPFVPDVGHGRRAVCEEVFHIQATGLARRLAHTKSKTAVLGVSGGLDSTLAALVIVEALKRWNPGGCKVLGITMPGFGTSGRTKGNAEKLAEALGMELRTIPIGDAVKRHLEHIGHPGDVHDITYENAQARERTKILMDVANMTNGLVVGTGDLSEAALGWCTFNGDHMSMYHVNAGVPKTLVRYVIGWCADELFKGEASAVLHDIIDTPISPELLPPDAEGNLQQKTEDVLGPYEVHDFFLFYFVRHGFSPAKVEFLANQAFADTYTPEEIATWLKAFLWRFHRNQFKRSSMPDGPKVGTVALSPRGDWRMPSDLTPGYWE